MQQELIVSFQIYSKFPREGIMGLKHTNLWEFTCDNCGKKERFAKVPDAQRPPKWHKYNDEFTEFDEVGNALHNHMKRLLLCDDCAKLKIKSKNSSPEMAALASSYLQMDEAAMLDVEPTTLFADIRSLAGSVLSQDPESSDPEESIDG